jgi:hypothetical protein
MADDRLQITAKTLPEGWKKFKGEVLDVERGIEKYRKRSELVRREFEQFGIILRKTLPAVGEVTESFSALGRGGLRPRMSPVMPTRELHRNGVNRRGLNMRW